MPVPSSPRRRRLHWPLTGLVVVIFMTSVAAAVVGVDGGHPQRADAADAPAELTAEAPPTTTTTMAPAPAAAVVQAPTTIAAPAPRTKPAALPPERAKSAIVKVGEIRIPKIGLVHPVFDGVTLTVIDHGPGHWPGSAMPGQLGNAVFAGHRVTHSHPFKRVNELVAGDEIVFVTDRGEFRYRMTKQEIVGPKDTWIVNPTPDATLTLFACHPPGSARQRIVIRAVFESATLAPGVPVA
jgi:sortase A